MGGPGESSVVLSQIVVSEASTKEKVNGHLTIGMSVRRRLI